MSLGSLSQGVTEGRYISLSEVRDEGLIEAVYSDATDSRVMDRILLAEEFIDRYTGLFFNLQERTLVLDGSGIYREYLPIPVVELSSVSINDMEQDLDSIIIYNRVIPDDRVNPKIEFKKYDDGNIFTGSSQGVFTKGQLNVVVSGSFGFLENGLTPREIKKATLLLVMVDYPDLVDFDARQAIVNLGKVIEEKTDGHSYKLSDSSGSKGGDVLDTIVANDGLTGISTIDNILRRFKNYMVKQVYLV